MMNSSASPVPAKSPTAFVVDDDPSNRAIFRAALESIGYQVMEAADGSEALDTLKLRTFNLLILDLEMPETNGQTVLRTIRQMFLHEKMYIAIMTANTKLATDDVHAIADSVVLKPVSLQIFLELARNCLPPHLRANLKQKMQ
jgi:two-component system, chemotaxis family, chemotaxis protein CheY